MTDQSSALFADLRASTCHMLGLDPANLSALESLRTDMVCSLRLECDRIMAQQLRGEPCDLRALTMATEALQNMLRPAFTAVADNSRADAEATAELARLLDGEIAARERELGEAMLGEELAAAAAALPIGVAPVKSDVLVGDISQPPANNTHVSFIDHACVEPSGSPPVPTPLTPADQTRFASLCNPNSQPRPRSPLTTSAYSPFAAWSAGQNGVKRWEPPEGF